MTCREARDLLLECVTGSTVPDVRRALQAHLQTCGACQEEAQALEKTVTLLRAAPEPHLSEIHWAEFARALQQRLDREADTLWRRFGRWVRIPRVAWSTAAATAALVVVLGVALLGRPTPGSDTASPDSLTIAVRELVTESMARSLPSMATALDVWNAEVAAVELPDEQAPGGGE